jgi:hypothetical protein
MATVQDIFESNVKPLPASERLRLAAMILDELVQPSSGLDLDEIWTDDDIRDVAAFSLRYAAEQNLE